MLFKFQKSVVFAAIKKYEEDSYDIETYLDIVPLLFTPNLQTVELSTEDMRLLGEYL